MGPGLSARRIFADLASGPSSQIKLVEEAHAAGMLPVISYKVGGDVSGAIAGKFNAAAEEAAAKLASYGLPTAVTIWHEPYKDMSGAEYAALHQQLMPIFKRGELRVGPILNGWLLDNQSRRSSRSVPMRCSVCGTGSVSTRMRRGRCLRRGGEACAADHGCVVLPGFAWVRPADRCG